MLGSLRGEVGGAVLAITLAVLLLVEGLFFDQPPRQAMRALGFGRPHWRAMASALLAVLSILFCFAAIAFLQGRSLQLVDAWPWLALGMFLQGGLAEETLFRGYLYRHYRQRLAFWPAVLQSMLPFALVHTLLFLTLPFAIALASVALSVVTAFPLAKWFDVAGRSVWAPACVHAGIQGIKLFELPATEGIPLAVWWMLLCAAIPWLVFLPWFDPDRSATAR